jgi:hypothetical protein
MKVKKSSVWMGVSVVLAILLVISIVTYGFRGNTAAGSTDAEGTAETFFFMKSEACTTACDDMEPVAKEIAEKAGLSFETVKYFQPAQIPGYVMIHDNTLYIAGVQDEATLVQTLCQVTENEELCSEATVAEEKAREEELKSAEEKCEAMEKVEKPKLEVFYVSRCPFGVQAINSLYYVAKNFEDSAEIVPRLLVNKAADGKSTTSMHGEQEHIEDLRHICLREEQPEVFWDYINCYAETGEAEACEETANVDSEKLANCDGEQYALLDAEDWETIYQPAGGSGSPSFFLNGERINEYEFSQNGRSPENLKTIVCCSAEGELEACNNALSTAQPPRGFGKMEEGSADTGGEQLNCG